MSRAAFQSKHVAAVLRHQKDPIKALDVFYKVSKEDGFKHTLSTYKCIIDKLGSHGEFEPMERVIADMRRHVDASLLEGVYIGVIRNYGKCGKVHEAVDVFERMDFFNCEPSVQAYNAIMNLLVEYGFYDEAHKVYLRMVDKGIVPDVYTFTIRIKSFCKTKRPQAALRLLNNMSLQGCQLNAVAYCTVIGGFYDESLAVEAYELFNEMLSVCSCPDVTTFNKLVHKICKKGNIFESEKLLDKVLKRGAIPNLFTVNIFIQGFCRSSKINAAMSLFHSVGREGLTPDVVTFNTLMTGLCKNSKAEEAEVLLCKMIDEGCKPDAFSYNTIIDGYCKSGRLQDAERVLSSALFKGFVADEFTYCSLINGFCTEGNTDKAMSSFYEALEKGLKPSLVIFNTLVKGLSQQGLILEALQLMNEMSRKGWNPDIWTYNIIINSLCKMGCVNDAYNLVHEALSKGYVPDIFTFNTLIDGYCKRHKMDMAIEIIDRMWDYRIQPDVITFNTVLNGLCKAAKYDDVSETFKAMVEKGCHPNIITYNILIESLCRSRKIKEAFQIFDDLEANGLTADVTSYSTLINGMCDNGDLDGAYQLFEKLGNHPKISHTTSTYNILINGFCAQLNPRMAKTLFNEMCSKGISPDNYTYRTMIDVFSKTENIDSAYVFLLENIDKGFIPSLTTFGRVLNCFCVKHRVKEAVGIIRLMARKNIVPEVVHTIFESDKKAIAAPKLILEDLLRKSCITCYAYDLLYDGVRGKKLDSKKQPTQPVRKREELRSVSASFSSDYFHKRKLRMEDNGMDQQLASSGKSKLRYQLRSSIKSKDEKPLPKVASLSSATKRARTTPGVIKSMNVLDLSGKEMSAKPPRRLSIPAKTSETPAAKRIDSMTPISETRIKRSGARQTISDAQSSEASRSGTCRLYSRISSASYWLSQIKLAEAAEKHSISLGFFKLALEAGCEPKQQMQNELKAYARKLNLDEYEALMNELLGIYNITEKLEELRVSDNTSLAVQGKIKSSANDVQSVTSSIKSRNLKPKSLNNDVARASTTVRSFSKEIVQKKNPAAITTRESVARTSATLKRTPVNVTQKSTKEAVKPAKINNQGSKTVNAEDNLGSATENEEENKENTGSATPVEEPATAEVM